MDLNWPFTLGLRILVICQVFQIFLYVVCRPHPYYLPVKSADTPMLATISDIEVDLGEREGNFDLTFGLWTNSSFTETLPANTEPGFHKDA